MERIEKSINTGIEDIKRIRFIFSRHYKDTDEQFLQNVHFSIQNILNGVLSDLKNSDIFKKIKVKVLDFFESIKMVTKEYYIKKPKTFSLFTQAIEILNETLNDYTKSKLLEKV